MTTAVKTVMYTAEVVVEGGRDGHARSSDGNLDVKLDTPTELEGTGGTSFKCLTNNAVVLPSNGKRPVSISNRTQPNEYRSADGCAAV